MTKWCRISAKEVGYIAKEFMTDDEVELEIARLSESEAVKLAQKERRWRYRRRQYLYTLRWYEKRGKELMAAGVTEDDFADFDMEGGEKACRQM